MQWMYGSLNAWLKCETAGLHTSFALQLLVCLIYILQHYVYYASCSILPLGQYRLPKKGCQGYQRKVAKCEGAWILSNCSHRKNANKMAMYVNQIYIGQEDYTVFNKSASNIFIYKSKWNRISWKLWICWSIVFAAFKFINQQSSLARENRNYGKWFAKFLYKCAACFKHGDDKNISCTLFHIRIRNVADLTKYLKPWSKVMINTDNNQHFKLLPWRRVIYVLNSDVVSP